MYIFSKSLHVPWEHKALSSCFLCPEQEFWIREHEALSSCFLCLEQEIWIRFSQQPLCHQTQGTQGPSVLPLPGRSSQTDMQAWNLCDSEVHASPGRSRLWCPPGSARGRLSDSGGLCGTAVHPIHVGGFGAPVIWLRAVSPLCTSYLAPCRVSSGVK